MVFDFRLIRLILTCRATAEAAVVGVGPVRIVLLFLACTTVVVSNICASRAITVLYMLRIYTYFYAF